jgi:hypothetical protein
MWLKSLGIGMLATAIILAASIIGTHTWLGMLAIPFMMPFMVPATTVAAFRHPAAHDGGHTISLMLYGSMLVFGSLFYGAVAFLVLRFRFRKSR